MSDMWNGTKVALLDGGSGASLYTATEMPIDFGGNDTIGMLLGSDDTAYSFDPDDADYVADLFDGGTTATEFTGTGYSPQNLTTLTLNENNTNDRGEFDSDDVVFSGIDGDTIQFAVLAKQVGGDWTTPADDPVVAYLTSSDFPLPTNGGDVTIAMPSAGIVHIL